MKAVGFVIGKEMRALTRFNGYAGGVGLTSWAPTINIIRCGGLTFVFTS